MDDSSKRKGIVQVFSKTCDWNCVGFCSEVVVFSYEENFENGNLKLLQGLEKAVENVYLKGQVYTKVYIQ